MDTKQPKPQQLNLFKQSNKQAQLSKQPGTDTLIDVNLFWQDEQALQEAENKAFITELYWGRR